jgi:hypothetical protein
MELDLNDKALLQKAIARVSAANEVVQFLSDYFRDKYGLTPANAIMPDGQIINQETVVVSNGIGTLQGVTGNTN